MKSLAHSLEGYTSNTNSCLISISVVIYKPDIEVFRRTLLHLKEAIVALQLVQHSATASLFIIENSSTPESREAIEKTISELQLKDFVESLSYQWTEKNLGYSKGNNIAIRNSSSQFHLVLNPDVFMEPDTLSKAVDYMTAHKEVGLISPSVFGEDGRRHYLCKENPTFFIFFLRSFAPKLIKKVFKAYIDKFEMRYIDYAKERRNIPYLSGCFMFFRTDRLKKIDGFDERYFLYQEDADITREILQITETAYVPSIKIVHKWSRGTHRSIKLKIVTIISALKYFFKWRFKATF